MQRADAADGQMQELLDLRRGHDANRPRDHLQGDRDLPQPPVVETAGRDADLAVADRARQTLNARHHCRAFTLPFPRAALGVEADHARLGVTGAVSVRCAAHRASDRLRHRRR